MTRDEFLEALIAAPDTRARHVLMQGHPEWRDPGLVYVLKERADRLERDDARKSLEIGRIGQELADLLSDNEARAVAQWVQANAQDFLGELEAAAQCYEQAARLFEEAGKPLEAAHTVIGYVEILAKLGRFDQAETAAAAARRVFVGQEDLISQAKIDMNLGNLQYRRGRYAQALESYRSSAAAFQALGNNLYAAMNRINEANMLTVLDDFLGAERLHEQARPVFETAGLRTAVASVDLNLAIFHAYRGNYSRAFQTFEQARSGFSELDMQVNLALTDLEQSDLHLVLNLPGRALELAIQAEAALAEHQMPFESARARANQGVALARTDQLARAGEVLEQARRDFAAQQNEIWIAHTDLQRAEVLGRLGKRDQARTLAGDAGRAYETLGLKSKQSYAHILCAQLWADDSDWARAGAELDAAARAIESVAAPWLGPRIEACRGRIAEGTGRTGEAIEHYRLAASQTEQIMAALTAEEHRTAYRADKLQPYEALVSLYAAQDPGHALQWAEQAKSRALVDLLAAGIRPRLHVRDELDAHNAARLEALREELNWLYTRLTRGEAPGDPSAPAAAAETWAKIQEREAEASAIWRTLQARHAEDLSLFREAPLSVPEIQSGLPQGTAVLEYFVARGELIAFVLRRDSVTAHPLPARLRDLVLAAEELGFQFSKFTYGPEYYNRQKSAMLQSIRELLDRLGEALLAPVQDRLDGVDALIIVPHGPLHALPFQALRLAGKYLIETYTVSFAPSAAVLTYCWQKAAAQGGGPSLLVGVPDERATHVTLEIEALATLIPGSRVLLGNDATLEQVALGARGSGVLHLAAHGLFRPEAPLLSSIRLADRWMAVQDVYDLDLDASLVTLSACETGLGHDAGGDEMVGLVRGFLHAGAGSLLVSLWMVDDRSMTDLMTRFYTHWLAGKPKAQALRQAQLDLLGRYEHPYYWAPMVLVGNEK